MNDQEFHEGLKLPAEKSEEWATAAQAFVNLRQPSTPDVHPAEDPAPLPGLGNGEKVASAPTPGFAKTMIKDTFKRELGDSQFLRTIKDKASWPYVGLGAATLGGLMHHGTKPREELGGKSKLETHYGKKLEKQQETGEEGQGFSRKLRNRGTELAAGLSKTFREHPGKATFLGAMQGASSGLTSARMLGAGKPGEDTFINRLLNRPYPGKGQMGLPGILSKMKKG